MNTQMMVGACPITFTSYATSKLENIFPDLRKFDHEHHMEKIRAFMAEYDTVVFGSRLDMSGGKDFGDG